MSTQRMVKDSFWTDAYVEELDPTEKLVFLYLLTNPLNNIAGIYEIRPKRIAYETGFDKDMVEKLLQRLESDKKILRKDDWLLIVNHAKHQSYKNPNVSKGIQRILDELPDKVKALKGFETLAHFTLLNLTLPYLTSPNAKSESLVKKPTLTETQLIDKKKIDNIIHSFKEVNPLNKSWYGNTSQRKACKELVDAFGEVEVLKVIAILPQTNGMAYIPNITTPCKLRDKWADLEAGLKSDKAKKLTKGRGIISANK